MQWGKVIHSKPFWAVIYCASVFGPIANRKPHVIGLQYFTWFAKHTLKQLLWNHQHVFEGEWVVCLDWHLCEQLKSCANKIARRERACAHVWLCLCDDREMNQKRLSRLRGEKVSSWFLILETLKESDYLAVGQTTPSTVQLCSSLCLVSVNLGKSPSYLSL